MFKMNFRACLGFPVKPITPEKKPFSHSSVHTPVRVEANILPANGIIHEAPKPLPRVDLRKFLQSSRPCPAPVVDEQAGGFLRKTSRFLDSNSKFDFLRTREGWINRYFFSRWMEDFVECLNPACGKNLDNSNRRLEQVRDLLIENKIGSNITSANKNLIVLLLYGVANLLREKEDLSKILALHPAFENLKIDDAWRMMVDHGAEERLQHHGLKFEDEPGYLAGMHRAFREILELDLSRKKLDARMIVSLRNTAVRKVMKTNFFRAAINTESQDAFEACSYFTNSNIKRKSKRSHFSSMKPKVFFKSGILTDEDMTFGLLPNCNLTEAGFKELLKNTKILRDESGVSHFQVGIHTSNDPFDRTRPAAISEDEPFDPEKAYIVHTSIAKSREEALQKIASILATYRASTRLPNLDENQKLLAIATCCRDLEQTHPFLDGNARTFGFLVVNKLLLEAGLSPAMIEDPNRFDGFSAAELVEEIKRGQAHFKTWTSPPAPRPSDSANA